ncbi:MAG: hypothetical protein Q8P02_00775 [Candidatus Micrarchaeota archaeon]|nr:hypothetical protein [Candidatus Micrarchaeota archaeon]
MDVNSRHFALLALGGGLLSVVAALVFGNALVLAFAAAFFALAVFIQRMGGVLLPVLLSGLKAVETRGGWSIRDGVAVISDKDRFVASAFLEVDVAFSPSVQAEREPSYAASFEKALCALSFPAQFGLLVYALDVEKYRHDVLTRRLEAEMKLSRLRQAPKPDAVSVAKTERELAMHTRLLERLSAGQNPLDVLYYVSTAAEGASEGQAISRAKLQARELKTLVANALNVPVRELSGDALKQCLDWRVALPGNRAKLAEAFA